MNIGIETSRVPRPATTSRPPRNSVHPESAALKAGAGDPPVGEALRELVEVVDLSPARFEEEVPDEEPHQELRHPLRGGQLAHCLVDPDRERRHLVSSPRM
jgi:hypothetical protein